MTSARLAGTRAVASGGTGAGHCVTAGCQGCGGDPHGQPQESAQARGTRANKSGANAVPTDPTLWGQQLWDSSRDAILQHTRASNRAAPPVSAELPLSTPTKKRRFIEKMFLFPKAKQHRLCYTANSARIFTDGIENNCRVPTIKLHQMERER